MVKIKLDKDFIVKEQEEEEKSRIKKDELIRKFDLEVE